MDLGSVIIGAILTVLCIAPFLVMHNNRKKKQNQMVQYLRDSAQEHNCNIDKYEFCGDFVLGVDENKGFIFFFKEKIEEKITQFIDLSEIKKCQPIKKTRTVKTSDGAVLLTERVELCFVPKTTNKTETKLELYDEEACVQDLNGELPFADKWSKQINGLLKLKNA